MLLSKYVFVFTSFILFISCQPSNQKKYSIESIPDPKTLGESYVSNSDSILSKPVVDDLNFQLRDLDNSGRAHIDVVLLNSIGEQVPKDFAYGLFNHWKIGRKETDNGLLILIVTDQRRIEFETGYGLEGDLPDAICFRIQQKQMIPYIRENNFDTAVTEGVQAVIEHLNNPDQTGIAGVDSSATVRDSSISASSHANQDAEPDSLFAVTDTTAYAIDPSEAISTSIYQEDKSLYFLMMFFLFVV